jgi:SulP family sulfate permease
VAAPPIAGIVHAATVLLVMLLFARYAGQIPLAALAAVLVMVAWNMSEREHFRTLLRAPRSDIAVLLTTFGLTVFADLTIAVGVGMVLASMLFMKRMAEVTNIGAFKEEMDELDDRNIEATPTPWTCATSPRTRKCTRSTAPSSSASPTACRIRCGSSSARPRPSSCACAASPRSTPAASTPSKNSSTSAKRQGTTLLLSGVHAQPMFALAKYGLLDRVGEENMFGNIDDALNRAREIEGLPPQPKPPVAAPEVAREGGAGSSL